MIRIVWVHSKPNFNWIKSNPTFNKSTIGLVFENLKVSLNRSRRKGMREVRLFVDESDSYAEIISCRICHEAEFESSKTLEAPCSCSGTLKVYTILLFSC